MAEESKLAKLHCQNCGAPLPLAPLGGVTLLNVAFPDHLKQVASLLSGAATYAYCTVCEQRFPYDSAALCIIRPVKRILSYFPATLADQNSKVLDNLQDQLDKTTKSLGFEYEILTNPEKFRDRLQWWVGRSVIPLFSTLLQAKLGGQEAEIEWFKNNLPKIDHAFFAGAWLLTHKAIRFYVFGATDPAVFNDAEFKEKASHLGITFAFITPDGKVNPADVLENFKDAVRHVLLWCFFFLGERLNNERNLPEIEQRVQQQFHIEALEEEDIQEMADVLAQFEEDRKISPQLKYTLHALLATICTLAKLHNPREAQWAAWYIGLEIARRENKENSTKFDGMSIPTELARRTLTPEAIFDNFSVYLQRAGKGEGVDQLQYLDDIAHDLQMTQILGHYARDSVVIKLDQVTDPTAIDQLISSMIDNGMKEPEAAVSWAKPLMHGLVERDPLLLIKFTSQLRQRLFEAREYDEGVWVTVRTTEILNDRRFHSLAWTQVKECQTQLETLGGQAKIAESTLIGIKTEEGNCLRYAGKPQAALQIYDELKQRLPVDLENNDTRTNERNRAIALREAGRITESLEVLNQVLPFTRMEERGNILNSIIVALEFLGEHKKAQSLLKEALTTLPSGQMLNGVRQMLFLNLAGVSQALQDHAEASRAAQAALKIAEERHDFWQTLIAKSIVAAEAEDYPSDTIDAKKLSREVVTEIEKALAESMIQTSSESELVMRVLLSDRLTYLEEHARAEEILLDIADRFTAFDKRNAWVVWAKLARSAQNRHDNDQARTYLLKAYEQVQESTAKIETLYDPFKLMVDKVALQYDMAETFVRNYLTGTVNAADLRLVADFQASTILSRRMLTQRENLDPKLKPDNSVLYSDQSMLELAPPTKPMAILQIFTARSGIYMFITKILGGKAQSTILKLMDRALGKIMVEHAIFALTMASPKTKDDPLTKVEGWHEFRQVFFDAVKIRIPVGTYICLVPGPLSGMPFQLILGEQYPICFAPSLSIAHILNERRQSLDGTTWRPKSVVDFVVWRFGEKSDIVETFKSASRQLEVNLCNYGVQYTRIEGIDGTREALLHSLRTSDCVRLSCHGRARTDSQSFGLLVADDGILPPTDVHAADTQDGQRFWVDWQSIKELDRCAPVVFSAACASGLAISIEGGERIGLERPLLRAGTLTYVAPQWPVPVKDIQPLVNRMISQYLTNKEMPLVEIIEKQVNIAIDEGMPEWIARAVTLSGNWL